VNFDNVLDAMRVGNKSRFANHSKDPNAYAKVVLVNGDQKIGLYAKRLLLPGTEVLYNYM
jgi:SET domain-containing protein